MGSRAHSKFFLGVTKILFSFYLPQDYINLFAFSKHQSWKLPLNSARRNLDKPGTVQTRAGGPGRGEMLDLPYDSSRPPPHRAGAGPNKSLVLSSWN